MLETIPQLEPYIERGQVRYVFRNFPLNSIHPQAAQAAEAAECAGELGHYWEMHDALFERQSEWSGKPNAVQVFKTIARDLELDSNPFDACLDAGQMADRVSADLSAGLSRGVQSTPHFFVNDMPLVGAQPFSEFQSLIEFALVGGRPPDKIEPADSFKSLGAADAPVVITEYSDFQ